jgi:predicted GIY-YIG superfamily endonuclease
MAVYLICFDKKLHHAKHYIGFSKTEDSIQKRLETHKKGNGSRLLNALNKAKIDYKIVRVWPDADGKFERKLKKRGESKVFCPICNPKSWHKNGEYKNEKV